MFGWWEFKSSVVGFISRSLLAALVAYIIGYYWYVRTGNPQYLIYLLVAELITFSRPRVNKDISKMIRTGDLDVHLARPKTLYLKFFPIFVSRSLMHAVVTFVIFAPIIFYYGTIRLERLPIIVLPLLLHYSLEFVVAMTSFWIGNSSSVNYIVNKINFALSGTVIPLEFFPDWLSGISNFLPFKYFSYVPAKIITGGSRFADFSIGILWILALAGFAIFIEKKGREHYDMVGG